MGFKEETVTIFLLLEISKGKRFQNFKLTSFNIAKCLRSVIDNDNRTYIK